MSEIELSDQQKEALAIVDKWFKSPEQGYMTLGGYAGTGKTTLMAYLSKVLRQQKPNLKIAFCSYTGKATRVLESRLRQHNAIQRGDSISTIHRLMYRPEADADGNVVSWRRRDQADFNYGLIVVDEASMVTSQVWYDLQAYNVPILAVGDHGQLPPIDSDFNLMSNPQIKLEKIFRQQEGNPIIRLATMAREEGHIPYGMYGSKVWKKQRSDSDTQETLGEILQSASNDTLVLVGYNHTRQKLNKAIRGLREFESALPSRGDKVICLKNNVKYQLYNGMLGQIVDIDYAKADQGYYEAVIDMDDDRRFEGAIASEQFGAMTTMKQGRGSDVQLFDFAYAITVHKAQGSQAERVILFEERFAKMTDDDWRRWLYTAVTRASEELYIVG
jgi:exodeoxyribonuclease V